MVLRSYMVLEGVRIVQLRNTGLQVKYTSPFLASTYYQTHKLKCLTSIVDCYCTNSNTNQQLIQLDVSVSLLKTGYIKLTTSDTILSDYSVINILVFDSDFTVNG